MQLSIGQVAKSAGVSIDTIRFYEKEKLIPKPPAPNFWSPSISA